MPLITSDVRARRVAGAMHARQPQLPAESTGFPWQRAPARRDEPVPDPADLSWLPGSIEDTLARRRSVRAFGPDSVPSSLVRATVTAACEAEAATWPPRWHGAVTLAILVAAYRVDGMPRGLYATSTEPGGPALSADDAWLEALPALYADAPALLLICGDLAGACREAGPAGYTSMLVRAGTIGYAAWLWALSAGLAGSVYAGPSHGVTHAAPQLDANLRHLFTVALGVPADQAGPPSDGMTADRGAR
jgi:hypothetical protein